MIKEVTIDDVSGQPAKVDFVQHLPAQPRRRLRCDAEQLINLGVPANVLKGES